ncbi:hypothetical protein NKDENANG_01412 [Candidatus Entotheonellaceae bacterium PAL068K]
MAARNTVQVFFHFLLVISKFSYHGEFTRSFVVINDMAEHAIGSVSVDLGEPHTLKRFVDMWVKIDTELGKAFPQDLIQLTFQFGL